MVSQKNNNEILLFKEKQKSYFEREIRSVVVGPSWKTKSHDTKVTFSRFVFHNIFSTRSSRYVSQLKTSFKLFGKSFLGFS